MVGRWRLPRSRKSQIHEESADVHHDLNHLAIKKDGKCEVVDLSFAADYPATCTWGRVAEEKLPTFEVVWKPNRCQRKVKYFVIKKHLVHEFLYHLK